MLCGMSDVDNTVTKQLRPIENSRATTGYNYMSQYIPLAPPATQSVFKVLVGPGHLNTIVLSKGIRIKKFEYTESIGFSYMVNSPRRLDLV